MLWKKPNNSIYLNEKLKIFKCNEGYNFKNGECINVKCFKNCELCSEESSDEKDQKCISYKNGFLFQEDKGNCVIECLKEGYYRDNNKCKNCHKDCLTCNKGSSGNSSHCSSCKDDKLLQEDKGNCLNKCLKEGYYQDNKVCKNCYCKK